jgi:DNA-binding HxlR family transcriptional regulator
MANSKMCADVQANMKAVRDTLYVISGKWKLLILISICNNHKRFRDIERNIPGITRRMLSKELKEMEMNKLICRTVYDDSPVLVEYTATPYSQSLIPVVQAMVDWGKSHSRLIRGK